MAVAPAQSIESKSNSSDRVEKAGIEVQVKLIMPTGSTGKGELKESQLPAGKSQINSSALFTLSVKDARTGAMLSGLRPKVWMVPAKIGADIKEEDCQQLTRNSLSGKFSTEGQIDLNSFRLLSLNSDKTITIINPQLAFSRTKLESIIELPAVGADWVLSADKRLLFVTLPETSSVAVVDVAARKLASVLSLGGGKPHRIRMQPDGRTVWVALDQASKVAAIEIQTLRVTLAEVGGGLHDFAFTGDSRFVFVSNSASDNVTQLETASLARRNEFKVGQTPVTLAYSPVSKFVYVGSLNGGSITVLDPERSQPVAAVQSSRGIVALRFDPAGRFAVVVNQLESSVSVLDSAQNVLIATGSVVKEPDQVTFTERYAYVRGLTTEKFALLDLNDLRKGKVAAVEIQAGQQPPSADSANINISDMIAPTPEGNSVMIANAADRIVYYYTEGLMAPMGTLSNYKRAPLALMLLDNGLAESSPGVYSSNLQTPSGGRYVVPVLVEQPRFNHCFMVNVDGLSGVLAQTQFRVEALFDRAAIASGRAARLKFSLLATGSEKPIVGLRDIRILVMEPHGVWQQRHWARESEPGVYEIEQVFANKGDYLLSVSAESLGSAGAKIRPLALKVGASAQGQ